MYGDNYRPEDLELYERNELFLSKAETREDLSKRLVLLLMDKNSPRQDLHVLHKRACIQKGWE
jgi:hypothetical protein